MEHVDGFGEFDLGNNFDLLDLPSFDEFLINEIDDITLSQVCETIEFENAAYEGLLDFSLSPGNGNSSMMEIESKDIASSESRFAQPVSDDDIKNLIKDQENVNTKNNTKWAMNLFEKWRASRGGDIPELNHMTSEQMSFWLGRFVMEARKKDGTEYPPRSIYLILCGLLRFLKDNGVYDKNFLDESNGEFAEFRKLVDARMKSLIDKGLGCDVKQADPILPQDEETLWLKSVFGRETAEQLQHTVFFYACKLFGLRGYDEHHSLQCEQFKIGEDSAGRYIQFTGRATKTYKGGLGHLNVQSKNLKHHSPPGDRCMVDYFELYLESLGNTGAFYRRPLPPTDEVLIRFGQQLVGVNKLKSFMKTIAEKGELKGNFSNHSGKRTCATQLYISGVSEQEIMRRTGHRSEKSVRKYKRSSEQIDVAVSKILDPPQNKSVCVKSENGVEPPRKKVKCESASEENCSSEFRVLQDLTNSNKAVFANCSFNFRIGN
ncbi:uncharacterized protein LOC133203697 [Saccostrea echinata]|uniref:uncharacterized protein LOC133203697 n=1 Tax=Saccostrea echinata TaxID=191078 RepID=UPI002A832E0C|nr:uncharacterized protein LOC133203697 [Saccostrea echinata]